MIPLMQVGRNEGSLKTAESTSKHMVVLKGDGCHFHAISYAITSTLHGDICQTTAGDRTLSYRDFQPDPTNPSCAHLCLVPILILWTKVVLCERLFFLKVGGGNPFAFYVIGILYY